MPKGVPRRREVIEHEELDRYAVADGPIGIDGKPAYVKRMYTSRTPEEDAAALQRNGETNVFILETKLTWKGDAGRKTRTELSRTRVEPLVCPLCGDPLLDRNDFLRTDGGATAVHESCQRCEEDVAAGVYAGVGRL